MATSLGRLFTAYTNRAGVADAYAAGTIRFLFDGVVIDRNDLPAMHEMHDGDVVDYVTDEDIANGLWAQGQPPEDDEEDGEEADDDDA